MPSAQTHADLARRIAEACLLRGEFTLRSGRTSSYYLDKYLFSTRPDLLGPVGDLLAARIGQLQEELGPVDRLAGAELGGIPLVTVASLRTGLPSIFVRNKKKDYGTAKLQEGRLERGDRLIFLEDVSTTGGQAVEAIGGLREAGAQVVAVITAIDREEGRGRTSRGRARFEALFTKTDLGVSE